MNLNDELKLAYCCGLFDGEWCISLKKRNLRRGGKVHEYQLSIELKMTDKPVVELIY